MVQNSRCLLCPVQESCLDAFVGQRIVHQPFRSIARSSVAGCVAPQISWSTPWQGWPLFPRIEEHPMVDGRSAIDHWVLLDSREQWPTLPWSGPGDLWSTQWSMALRPSPSLYRSELGVLRVRMVLTLG